MRRSGALPRARADICPDRCCYTILFGWRGDSRWVGAAVGSAAIGRPGRIEDLVLAACRRDWVASGVAAARLAEHHSARDGTSRPSPALVGQVAQPLTLLELAVAVLEVDALIVAPSLLDRLAVTRAGCAAKVPAVGGQDPLRRLAPLPADQSPCLRAEGDDIGCGYVAARDGPCLCDRTDGLSRQGDGWLGEPDCQDGSGQRRYQC